MSEAASLLPFPQSLSEKYQPRSLDSFVGLDEARRVLAAFARNPYPSSWLFVGPSGVGKTSMGLALAWKIPAEVHHIPSQNCTAAEIERVVRTCHYVPMSGFRMHLILIDEADRMTDGAQVQLLSKLDATAFPPNTVFVFTCNSVSGLEPRFLSRCRVLEFSSYGIAPEATALLEKVWDAETAGRAIAKPNFGRILKESCNNIRDALMTLEIELMGS